MDDKLSRLQCHFNWKPLEGVADYPRKCKVGFEPQSRIDFLKTDIKMNPEIEVSALTLIAYLYAQLQTPNFQEALCISIKAIDTSKTFQASAPERAKGYKIVCLSIKAHLLHLGGHSDQDVNNIISEIEELNPILDKAQAFIHGIHAYACSTLGPAKYKQGLGLSLRAAKLDPTWYAWPMGAASLAGRMRRFVEGVKSYPTAMEEENMKKAVVLSQEKQPLPIVFLADLYFIKGRFNGSDISNCAHLLYEAEKLYKMAYKIGSKSIYVLTRCGKAFATMQYDSLAEECFIKSLELQPNDGVSLRGLGKLYEFSENKRNITLALNYYQRASMQWESQNVHSDLDLCRVRKKVDPNFDEFKQYHTLSVKYSDDKRALTYISNTASRQEDYLQSKQSPKNHYSHDNRNDYKKDSPNNFKRHEVNDNPRGRNYESSIRPAHQTNVNSSFPQQNPRFGQREPFRARGQPHKRPSALNRKYPSNNNLHQNWRANEEKS